MSILTDLIHGKITFETAATQVETDAAHVVAKLPAPIQAAVQALIPALKQAASNAVDMADTALGTVIIDGTPALETLANAAIAKYVPAGTPFTPMVDDAINRITAALKAELDAVALAAKAALANPQPTKAAAPVPVVNAAAVANPALGNAH